MDYIDGGSVERVKIIDLSDNTQNAGGEVIKDKV